MAVERKLQKLQKFLDAGQIDQAGALLGESVDEVSEDPRALLPVLDGLDRQRNEKALEALIGKLHAMGVLPLECAIFELRIKFRAANHADTLHAVDKVLSQSSEHIEALRTGGRIGNLIGDEALSLSYWERLARTSASDPEAALQVARIYRRRKQQASALEWACRAADRRPELAEPLQIAVVAGVETGWPQSCDVLLARLLKVDRAGAMRSLSRLVLELDPEGVARLLSFLQQQFSNDQELSEIIVKAHSGWLVSALEQELASRELDAAMFYRAARTVRPNDANVQRALERLSLPSLVAMRDAFNGRDFSGAVEHGLMAARINPDNFEAWQTVGRAQFTRNNIADASDAFRRCTELNSKDANSWLTYGLTLNQAGDRRAALAAFRKAHGFADSETRRETDASITSLQPLLVRDAEQAAKNGDLELAWSSCQAALEIRPDDAGMTELKRNLVRQLRDQIRVTWNSQGDQTADLCRRFLEKVPNDVNVSTILGRTLMKARAYDEALPVWESLCRQKPQDSHNHLQVARCCRSLRIKDKGLSAAETALRIDPKLQEAAEMADFLRNLPSLLSVKPQTGGARR